MSIGGGGSKRVSESPYEKELARIRDEAWSKYQARFPDQERQAVGEARAPDAPGQRERERGRFATTVQQSLGVRRPQAGQDPSSGGAQAGIVRETVARGGGTAEAMTEADIGAGASYLDRLTGTIELGQGIQNRSLAGTSRAARNQQARSFTRVRSALQEESAAMGALGTAAGYGVYRWRTSDPATADPRSQASGVMAEDGGESVVPRYRFGTRYR